MKVPKVAFCKKSQLFTASLALVFVALVVTSLTAQQAKPAERTVELSVIVTDAGKKSVASLRKEDVHVFEDKIEQTVQSIVVDERPIDCGLLIDSSASMRALLSANLETARLIIVNARPDDQFFISRFISSDKIQTVQDFTSDANLLVQALSTFYVEGGQSAIIDAIYVGAEHVSKHNAKNPGRRKVLIVITDGEDRNSYYKSEHLQKLLRDLDVQVFAIGFTSKLERDKPGYLVPAAKDKAEKLLRTITETAGGRVFFPTDRASLTEALAQLVNDMHSQFRLTYQSASDKKGFRKVEMKVTAAGGEKLNAVAPGGYYVEK